VRTARAVKAVSTAPPYVAPGHFYSPLTTDSDVQRALTWDEVADVDLAEPGQLSLARKLRPVLEAPMPGPRYTAGNRMFGVSDAAVYRAMITHLRPARIIEVGSGYSTARKAGELDPEWVMAGVDVPAGKRLYASKDLKGSAFHVAMDQYGNGDGWHLTSTMCHMLVITKPTYGECLAELMTIWANWDAEGRDLPAGGGTREYPGMVAR